MAKPQPMPERDAPAPETAQNTGLERTRGRSDSRKNRRGNSGHAPKDVTGINPEKMEPIDPRMVYIPPA